MSVNSLLPDGAAVGAVGSVVGAGVGTGEGAGEGDGDGDDGLFDNCNHTECVEHCQAAFMSLGLSFWMVK